MSLDTSYRSPAQKLLKWFKESRDNWKTKYQELKKNVKQLENRIRFLESSKNKWKKEAIELRAALKKKSIDTNTPEMTTTGGKSKAKKEELMIVGNNNTVAGHTYSVEVILLLLQLVLSASISLRGSERVLTVVNDSIGQPLKSIPSWFSVRFWLLRIGYYKLMRPKMIAEDWCWILDHTIQLGRTKCLLILGIRLCDLPANGQCLSYCDLEPIDLFPVESSTGEIVFTQLEETTEKTGVPRVILSDYGSDLKLGITSFIQKHHNTVHVYDIKHKTATLLKSILEKDVDWDNFKSLAAKTKNQLQQTVLSHLKAPNQRNKARYMNIGKLVKWGNETLQLIEKGEFNSEVELEKSIKLEWLKDYKAKLAVWDEYMNAIILTEQFVRQEGITKDIHQKLEIEFKDNMPEIHDETTHFIKDEMINFLKTQGESLKTNERLPGSSEIIESVFGKQKYLEKEYSKGGFGHLILAIGAIVSTTTAEVVKKALETVPVKAVKKWCKEKLGDTTQSKRKEAYSSLKKEEKQDQLCQA